MNKQNLEKLFNDDLGSSYFPCLAETYLKEGDYVRAKEVCNIGLLLNPSNNDGKFILAKIAIIQDHSKKAVHLLKEIIASDDLYISAMKMLVMIYKKSGKNQALMMKIVHQILDLLPGDEFSSDILKSSVKKKIRVKKRVKAKKIITKKPLSSLSKNNVITKKKASKKDIEIDPKMATLTFVDILIKQKQYQKASDVLNLVKKKKSISNNSIKTRIKKIVEGFRENE